MNSYGGICLGVTAFVGLLAVSLGQTYADTMAIFNDKLNNGTYSVDVRPVKDQSKVLQVNVSFSLLTIVDVDDVSQSFNCNGFIAFVWMDEMLAWDPQDYGGQTMIHPQAKDIWRPRVILGNTLEDRDIFAENNAPIILTSDGVVRWFPGSTFPTSCALNMTNYPFDKQLCYIQLVAMGYTLEELEFVAATEPVDTDYFISNGEWVLDNAAINILNTTNIGGYYLSAIVLTAMGYLTDEVQFVVASKPVQTQYFVSNGEWVLDNATIIVLNSSDGGEYRLSTVMVTFSIKRNPDGILVNIILPVVFLSFLNLWVFVIPVESGEKISYGTTVLMALSVFMTTMSAMLPLSSDKLPLVVIYLFVLLILSLLTVITSIIIVFLHHKEEVTFSIKRNPDGILVNIILPVVFLSFLNLWVFVIPVESGEKISYGTTVLMALSVFMTTMSAMLPLSSDKLPLVVIYLFVLLILSLLTVITSIIIVFLHHKEEKEVHHMRAKSNIKRITGKVIMVNGAMCALENTGISAKNPNKVQPFTPQMEEADAFPTLVKDKKPQCDLTSLPNRYRLIGKYIDLVSLIIFFGAWLIITLGFLLKMSS